MFSAHAAPLVEFGHLWNLAFAGAASNSNFMKGKSLVVRAAVGN